MSIQQNNNRFDPPITTWPNLMEFKAFLKRLEQLNLPVLLPQLYAVSHVDHQLNFYGPHGSIQADFMGWFFHYYNMQSKTFTNTIWEILLDKAPAITDYIRNSPFSEIFTGSKPKPMEVVNGTYSTLSTSLPLNISNKYVSNYNFAGAFYIGWDAIFYDASGTFWCNLYHDRMLIPKPANIKPGPVFELFNSIGVTEIS